jgi:rare lipoprotein A
VPGPDAPIRQNPTGPERPVRGAYSSGPTASGARAGADAAGAHDFDPVAVADAVPRVEPPSKLGNRPTYKVFGVEYKVLASAKGYKERGIASWYGAKFHGARTSSGEPYDMYSMSAAHKTLPLPTYARVTNLDNGKSVIVRINDRGPFKHNRVMDLSYAAALKLDIVAKGTGKVEVEAIDAHEWERTNAALERALEASPVGAPEGAIAAAAAPTAELAPLGATPTMWLQVGAFGDRGRAEQLRDHLKRTGVGEASLVDAALGDGKILVKVRLGPYGAVEALDTASKRLTELGHGDYQLVIE